VGGLVPPDRHLIACRYRQLVPPKSCSRPRMLTTSIVVIVNLCKRFFAFSALQVGRVAGQLSRTQVQERYGREFEAMNDSSGNYNASVLERAARQVGLQLERVQRRRFGVGGGLRAAEPAHATLPCIDSFSQIVQPTHRK